MPCAQFTRHSSLIVWGIPWFNTVEMSCAQFTCCSSPITWEVLGPMLLDCLVCNLCIVRPLLFLGNSCSHFILERLCFLCVPFFCHFSLGPSTPFPSECLLCVSLALFFVGMTLSFACSVGTPSKYFFCWHNLS